MTSKTIRRRHRLQCVASAVLAFTAVTALPARAEQKVIDAKLVEIFDAIYPRA